jgi:hypothetical protein
VKESEYIVWTYVCTNKKYTCRGAVLLTARGPQEGVCSMGTYLRDFSRYKNNSDCPSGCWLVWSSHLTTQTAINLGSVCLSLKNAFTECVGDVKYRFLLFIINSDMKTSKYKYQITNQKEPKEKLWSQWSLSFLPLFNVLFLGLFTFLSNSWVNVTASHTLTSYFFNRV